MEQFSLGWPRCEGCKQQLGPDVKFYETTVMIHHQGCRERASTKFYHYGACPKPEDARPKPGRFNNLEMP